MMSTITHTWVVLVVEFWNVDQAKTVPLKPVSRLNHLALVHSAILR